MTTRADVRNELNRAARIIRELADSLDFFTAHDVLMEEAHGLDWTESVSAEADVRSRVRDGALDIARAQQYMTNAVGEACALRAAAGR